MDLFTPDEPVEIDLVYADAKHPDNIFGEALYYPAARLSLHQDLARVSILAARILHERHGQKLILKDGLRPVEAQQKMAGTKIVLQNPRWLEEPGRLVSPPGAGAHPRGMAIDAGLRQPNGEPVDMGTAFDTMTARSARNYDGFAPEILNNRKNLEAGFVEAAQRLGLPLLPLPSEWWDFRFPRSYYSAYRPWHDHELPAPLKMCKAAQKEGDDDTAIFDKRKQDVLNSL